MGGWSPSPSLESTDTCQTPASGFSLASSSATFSSSVGGGCGVSGTGFFLFLPGFPFTGVCTGDATAAVPTAAALAASLAAARPLSFSSPVPEEE